jgi:hypothetical protein
MSKCKINEMDYDGKGCKPCAASDFQCQYDSQLAQSQATTTTEPSGKESKKYRIYWLIAGGVVLLGLLVSFIIYIARLNRILNPPNVQFKGFSKGFNPR